MMDMPETIWAKCEDVHGAIQVGGWADTVRQCPDGTKYRRANLPPRVKPLVWTVEPRNGWKHGVCYAPPYHIIRRDDGWHYANGDGGVFSELEAAKAAAQADYTARIIAALEGEA